MKMLRVRQVSTSVSCRVASGVKVSHSYFPEYRTRYWPFWRNVTFQLEAGEAVVSCASVFEAWDVLRHRAAEKVAVSKFYYSDAFNETAP